MWEVLSKWLSLLSSLGPQPPAPYPPRCILFQEINSMRSALQEFGGGTLSLEPPGRGGRGSTV